MRGIFFLALTCCGILAVRAQYDTALDYLVAGNHKFTAEVYKELLKKENGNFIYSPFSAETVLALTSEGAKGLTYNELARGLHLPQPPEISQKAFKTFLTKLNLKNDKSDAPVENGVQLRAANKIYVAQNTKLEPEFRAIAEKVYSSGVENVDFANNEVTADKINQWVEDQTNNRIKNLIDPSNLDGLTKLVLVNALYFKGKWLKEFEDYATTKKKFYRTKGDSGIDVDMMRQTESFNYYENHELDAKFLEMKYDDRNCSMVIVLPNQIDGISRLEQNLEKVLEPQPMTYERVDVQLPKFKIETTINFVPILQTLGINTIFNAGRADLSGLSSTDKDLYVSTVIQKAFIEVNEAGTEAAAATAVEAQVLSLEGYGRKSKKFHAINPFLFYLKQNGVVLFAGKITTLNPSRFSAPIREAQSGYQSPTSPDFSNIYFLAN